MRSASQFCLDAISPLIRSLMFISSLINYFSVTDVSINETSSRLFDASGSTITTPISVDGLLPWTNYNIQASVVNSVGPSPSSGISSFNTLPSGDCCWFILVVLLSIIFFNFASIINWYIPDIY